MLNLILLSIVLQKNVIFQDSEVDVSQLALNTLNEILEKTVLRSERVQDVGKMLEELVEQLPINFILQREIIQSIVSKITSSYANLMKDELVDAVQSLTTSQKDEIEAVLEYILEEVFGIGIDYLYYVQDI